MKRITIFRHQDTKIQFIMEEQKSNVLIELLKNSTPEQRKEAQAIAKFISKMMSLAPDSKLEDQMKILDQYFLDNGEKHTRDDMAPYMLSYIDNVCQDYYNRNKENFEKLEEKDPFAIVVGLIMADYIFTADHSKPEVEVFSLYHKYIEDYRSYVEGIIINKDRYDLTVNSGDVFKKYVKFKSDYKEAQKEKTLGQVFGTISEHMDKYIPLVKELKDEGLDSDSVEHLVTEVLINEYLLVATGLSRGPLQQLGPVQGMSDAVSIRKYISVGERISNEFELSEGQKKNINTGTELLNKMIPSSSGCLGMIIAIITVSATLIGLIGWGVSALIA